MKQIEIEFEKFEGDLDTLIDSSSDGDKYLLQMVDKEYGDKVEVKFCEVHKIANGMIGILNGNFYSEFDFMDVIGICKVIC